MELIARQRLAFLPGFHRIRKGINLFITGTNLTNRPQISYTGSPKFPEDISYSGKKFSFGVDYAF